MNLEVLFGSKMQTRLMQLLLQNREKVFNQASLARFLDCSPSTVARLIQPLVREGILMYEQLHGQMKVIALNSESEKTKAVIDFYDRLSKL